MRRLVRIGSYLVVFSGTVLGGKQAILAKAPTVAQALQLTPIQRGAVYDQPETSELAKCTISAEKSQRRSAWIVRDSGGQTLRQFADTNGDNNVDQWSYYQAGLEMYRELDANFNGKADQYRWLSTAGTRWGADANEDGIIDSWRMISAEEVAEEVILAVRENDAKRFQALLLSEKELAALGVGKDHQAQIAKRVGEALDGFRRLTGELGQRRGQIEFVDFGGTKPSIVPAGLGGATRDVVVYENTAALAGLDGKHEQVSLGTLVKVDDAWRLVGAPTMAAEQPVGAAALFFVPQVESQPDPQFARLASNGPSEEEQKLLVALEELDRKISEAAPQQRAQLNDQRIRALEQLAAKAGSESQRALWLRQLADMISAESQGGFLPDGIKRLNELKVSLEKSRAEQDLVAHVDFLSMTAAYSQSLQDPKADYVKIQEQWLANLEAFVKKYPESRETADALIQLGMAQEFNGDTDKAQAWYTQLADDFGESDAAKKAQGALRRLASVGKPLNLQGAAVGGGIVDLSELTGKVVLVQYWATWCEPCLADIARLREIYREHKDQGFEIVGINVDTEKDQLAAYVKENPLPWRNIHEEGGLESRPAVELGIMTLPQMLLLDKDGRVINRNAHVAELTSELGRLLK